MVRIGGGQGQGQGEHQDDQRSGCSGACLEVLSEGGLSRGDPQGHMFSIVWLVECLQMLHLSQLMSNSSFIGSLHIAYYIDLYVQ